MKKDCFDNFILGRLHVVNIINSFGRNTGCPLKEAATIVCLVESYQSIPCFEGNMSSKQTIFLFWGNLDSS